MTNWDDPTFTCPDCGMPVASADEHNAWGMSKFVCAEDHCKWTGLFPCGPDGHDAGETPDTVGKCKFCLRPMPDPDKEEV